MRFTFYAALATLIGLPAMSETWADPPAPRDDSFVVDQGSALSGNLFADNGQGLDSDPEGDPFRILYIRAASDSGDVSAFDLRSSFNIDTTRFQSLNGETQLAVPVIDVGLDGQISITSSINDNRLGEGQVATGQFEYAVTPTVSISQLSGTAGGSVQFQAPNGEDYSRVATGRAGDYNRDGRDDWLVMLNGRLYVVFGANGVRPASVIQSSDLTGDTGALLYTLNGSSPSFQYLGDINDDGFGDIVVSQRGTGFQRTFSILFGTANPAVVTPVEISDSDSGGASIVFGQSSGDFNGDGINDLAISTRRAAADVRFKVAIIFGRSDLAGAPIDLASLSAPDITWIELEPNFSPSTFGWMGDLNNDTRGDLALGQSSYEVDGFYNAGAIHVLFGQESPPAEIGSAALDGTSGVTITGNEVHGVVGSLFTGAGDVNGDSVSDLIIQAGELSGEFRQRIAVVFGGAGLSGSANRSLSDLISSQGVEFVANNGRFNLHYARGDINGDGIGDIFLSLFNAEIGALSEQEGMAIIYGRAGLAGVISEQVLDGQTGSIIMQDHGPLECPLAPHFLGDIDGNSAEDIFLGATQFSTQNMPCFLAGGATHFGSAFDTQLTFATVDMQINGVNDPLELPDYAFSLFENDYLYEALFNQGGASPDPDSGDRVFVATFNGAASQVGRWVNGPQGGRVRIASDGLLEFDPTGMAVPFEHSVVFSVPIMVASTDGTNAGTNVQITVNGTNSAPEPRTDFLVAAPGQTITGNLFADNGSGADTYDASRGNLIVERYSSSTANLTVGATETTDSGSTIRIESNGDFTYTPGTQQALAGAAPEQFSYRVTYPDRSRGASGFAFFAVQGVSDAMHQYTLNIEGIADGMVRVYPAQQDCTGTCAFQAFAGTAIIYTVSRARLRDDRFPEVAGWGGDCADATGTQCQLTLSEDLEATVQIGTTSPRDTVLFAASLPAARSGLVGGTPMTLFTTVANTNRAAASQCRIGPTSGAPFTLEYQRTDATNTAIGELNPTFDLAAGAFQTFVVAYTPTRAFAGNDFFLDIICQNGRVTPIRGVNSVFLSASETPVPDILSIGATPSGDGVIRISSVGGISFLSAAAVNIGAGDPAPDGMDAPQANEATITVTADTGLANLPLDITLCETGADARCLAARSTSVESQIGDSAKTFAVFVRASNDAGVAFDPANARVYLRFTDGEGVVRSVTSAAVTAPAPASPMEHPAGLWSMVSTTGAFANEFQLILGPGQHALLIGETRQEFRLNNQETDGETRRIGIADLDGRERFAGELRPGLSLRLVDQQSGRSFRGVAARQSTGTISPGAYQLVEPGGLVRGLLRVTSDGSFTGSSNGCRFAGRVSINEIENISLAGCAVDGGLISFFERFDPVTNRYRQAISMPGSDVGYLWIQPSH
jgi:hypothetical protein